MITVTEILSDFYSEILPYIPDPTTIAKSKLFNLIDKCQRNFAREADAFDDILVVDIKEDVAFYSLPDNFLEEYLVKYNGVRISPNGAGLATPGSVKYYDIYDNKIVLLATPTEDNTAYLKVYYYRLPNMTIKAIGDEVELLGKHPKLKDAVVNFLLYEILKTDTNGGRMAEHFYNLYQKDIEDCSNTQSHKRLNKIMEIGN